MKREKVAGIGGIFFKSENPERLMAWYKEKLGIEAEWDHGHVFKWKDPDRPDDDGMTVWSIFPASSTYMDPGGRSFMINYRVHDLQAMLQQLRDEGATVDEKIEESEFGKFGWTYDADGNKVELWEPPTSAK